MWESFFSSVDRMRRVEVARNADGRLEAFGVAPDNTVWRTSQTAPAVWSGVWQPFYSPLDEMRELRIGMNADGRMEIFGVAPDDSVWHTWQDTPGGAWTGAWQLLYSTADRMRALDVGRNADGRIEVIGVAPDTTVWRTVQIQPGIWAGGSWSLFYSASDQLVHVRVGRNIDGRLEAFGSAPNDTVWRTWQISPGVWSGSWTELYSAADWMRRLEVAENADGRLEILGIAPNHTVWHTAQSTPGTWAGAWEELYSSSDELEELRVARNADGTLAAVGVSADQQIWHTWQTTPGNWAGGWTALTGHIRVLIKIITTPVNAINTMLANMRTVFATVGIKVLEGPRETIVVIPAPMAPPQTMFNVGPCTTGSVTADQTRLYANRNFAGPKDIVLYFATAVQSDAGPKNGCATFPPGQPGAVMSRNASIWTMAHETAHVLGLDHITGESVSCPPGITRCCNMPDFTRLMTECSTNRIIGIPTLSTAESATMNGSNLIREKDQLVTICIGTNFDGRLEVLGTSADDQIWRTWQVAANGPWNEGGG
jgi:hypothetical protein